VPSERTVGVIAVVVAIVGAAFANVINNDPGEEGEWSIFIVSAVLLVPIGAFLFGRVVPRARERQPARTGLVMSILGFLTVAAFWTGLPYLLGAGGAFLGLAGEVRSPRTEARGLAIAAMLIGALAIALATVAFVGDEAS
jgi:amino acid transporter